MYKNKDEKSNGQNNKQKKYWKRKINKEPLILQATSQLIIRYLALAILSQFSSFGNYS